jgi:hypothetical protein
MRRRGFVLPFVGAVIVAGCSSSTTKEAAAPLALGPGCRIKVPESQDKPFIVDWDEARRRALTERARSGVIVVHYEDCRLEVLDRCTATKKYRWLPTAPKQDRISISNVEQLWANVPTDAAVLEDKLGAGGMTIESTRVGSWHAMEPVGQPELQGDCARATHAISSIIAGAFEMRMENGVLAQHSDRGQPFSKDGRMEACGASSEGQPPTDCSSPFRIEVTKIQAASHVCKSGDRVDCAAQCKNGNETSCQRLADVMINDEDSERTSLYKRGCDRDDQRACNNFGVMLVRGIAVAHDLPRARQILVKSCESGIAEACSNAGVVLGRDEYGKPLDDPNADVRLREACAKRIAVACFVAGSRTAEDGKSFAAADAVDLLTKACDLEHGSACAKLAALHRPKDRGLADKLAARACARGARSSCPGHDPRSEDNEAPWSELLLVPSPP